MQTMLEELKWSILKNLPKWRNFNQIRKAVSHSSVRWPWEAHHARRKLGALFPPSLWVSDRFTIIEEWGDAAPGKALSSTNVWCSYIEKQNNGGVRLGIGKFFLPSLDYWDGKFVENPYWSLTRQGICLPLDRRHLLLEAAEVCERNNERTDLLKWAGKGKVLEPETLGVPLYSEHWGKAFLGKPSRTLKVLPWVYQSGINWMIEYSRLRSNHSIREEKPKYLVNYMKFPLSLTPTYVNRIRKLIKVADDEAQSLQVRSGTVSNDGRDASIGELSQDSD